MSNDAAKPEVQLATLIEDLKGLENAASLLFSQQRVKFEQITAIAFDNMLNSCASLVVYARLVLNSPENRKGSSLIFKEEMRFFKAICSKLSDVFKSQLDEHKRAFADDVAAMLEKADALTLAVESIAKGKVNEEA